MKKIVLLMLAIFCLTGCNEKDELIVLNTEDSINVDIDKESNYSSEEGENEDEDVRVPLPKKITVYVCGAVNNPGVYDLKSGSRVNDAIISGGGAKDNAALEYMNLANEVKDGEKIYVINTDEAKLINEGGNNDSLYSEVSPEKETNQSSNSSGSLVNLNTASKEQLMSVPGIGESKAEKIISFRETQKFKSIEDIMLISGIKEGMFNKIKDYICV